MPNQLRTSRHRRFAFTLIELMVVVMIMSIVAASVLPAMANVRSMRAGAARDDLVRLIEITKASAMASGNPAGVRVDLSDSTLTVVRRVDGGVEAARDPLAGNDRVIDIGALYPGVALSTMTNGDGVAGSGTVWFDYIARPHTRDPDGEFVDFFDQPARIEFSSGDAVLVHPHTGVVELP